MTLWFEVKEFDDDPRLVKGQNLSGAAYDPHAGIRRKINKAVAKFRDYDGECCSLVLFNERVNLVQISEARIVLGAMYGDVALKLSFDPETELEGPATQVFTQGGKLVHPHQKKPRNSTISAVVALERFPVGEHELEIKVEEAQRCQKHRLLPPEILELWEHDREGHERRVLRAIVYENIHAVRPLPRNIFTGPWDERWGRDGDNIKPVYVGANLADLRARFQLARAATR
jgi:hypothetical protein